MLSFRWVQRQLSRFMGSPEEFLATPNIQYISTLSITGVRPCVNTWFKPSDQGMANLAKKLTESHEAESIKHLQLTHCNLSPSALESVCKIVQFGSLESLAVRAEVYDDTTLAALFKALSENKGLKIFEARGPYHSSGSNILSESLTIGLANIVTSHKTIEEIFIDQIAISEKHRSIILNTYGEVADRPRPNIEILGFVKEPENQPKRGAIVR